MKLTYNVQMVISVIIIVSANILTEICVSWIYRSIGFGVCGLLWIIHPILPKGAEVSKRSLLWTRISGVILILIGVFTRVHY